LEAILNFAFVKPAEQCCPSGEVSRHLKDCYCFLSRAFGEQLEHTELGSSPSPDSEIDGEARECVTEGGPRRDLAEIPGKVPGKRTRPISAVSRCGVDDLDCK
jgi:hypothetical protein